jgi:heme/copper-type cytochrome/quinol oxidase subunit 4
MLDFLLWSLVLIAFSVLMYLQFRYAHAGCPNDWRWRVTLFAVGGFVVDLGGYLVITRIDKESFPPMAHLFSVIFGGLLFASPAWWMQNMILPKSKHDR